MDRPGDASALPGVVVAGHLCLDLIPDLRGVPEGKFAQLFRPGQMVHAGPMSFSTGGAASNTGLALARLGLPVRIAARVGDDPFSEVVRAILRRHGPGIEAGVLTTPGAQTSYTVIVSAPGVDRIFLHCPGANDDFSAGDVSNDVLEGAALFHFGYPPLLRRFYQRSGRELRDLFSHAKASGATTSLDLTLPDPASAAGQADWVAILTAALPYVDIFLPSFEETLFMLRRRTYDVLLESAGGDDLIRLATPELLHSLTGQMLDLGAKIVGLKLGERGFYLRTAGAPALAGLGHARPANPAAWAGQTLWAPCFAADVAGTTGAGDTTIAGFLCALLRGLGPRAALAAANAVGACCVEAPDAFTGLRSWEDTLARVAAGWARKPLGLSQEDWELDEESGVFIGK